MKIPTRLAIAFLLSPFLTVSSQAITVFYSFELPEFSFGQSTPFTGMVPNVGPASFTADFTVPTGGSFGINTTPIVPLFSGQCLMDFNFPADTLAVHLNTPITDVQLDFALFLPGSLAFSSSAGNTTATSSGQQGVLSFHSNTGFTDFSLQGFDSSSQPTIFAIDNLSMTTVPEPQLAMLLPGVLGAVWIRSRRQTEPKTI